jgi:hypothetical protein
MPLSMPDNLIGTYERLTPPARRMPNKPNPSIDLDENVQKQIRFLRMAIHDDAELLIHGFVKKTSNIKLPETISERLPNLTDIEDAVSRIEVFLQIAQGQERAGGLVILGEKGAGKTTLTHYASALHGLGNSSFLFLPIDYQWIPIFEIHYEINYLGEELFRVSGLEQTEDPDRLRSILKNIIENETWHGFDPVSLEHRNRLSFYEHDDTFVVEMYCHFNKRTIELNRMLAECGYPDAVMIGGAHEWLAEIRKDPRKMLAYCLLFSLEKESANFRQFSWERITASVIKASKKNERIKAIFLDRLPQTLEERFEDGRLDPIDISPALKKSGKTLTNFSVDLLNELASKFTLVLFIDNIDARYDIFLETRLISIC